MLKTIAPNFIASQLSVVKSSDSPYIPPTITSLDNFLAYLTVCNGYQMAQCFVASLARRACAKPAA